MRAATLFERRRVKPAVQKFRGAAGAIQIEGKQMNTDRMTCRAINKKGAPCRAAATETGFCFVHSQPGRAAEMGRRGGLGNRHFVPSALPPLPALDTSEGVRKAIELFIAEAYAGNENAKRMLAFAPMLGTLGKMIKIADVEERLKKVEAMVAAQQHGREEEGTEKNEQDTKKPDAGTGGDNEEDK
jgi:hypothetical protein